MNQSPHRNQDKGEIWLFRGSKLTSLCCVLGKDTQLRFPLLSGLGKRF